MVNNAFWGGVIFSTLALYLLRHALRSSRLYGASKSWPSVPGKIIESEVVRYSATSGRRDFAVKYQYRVGNRHYQGNRVALYTIGHQEAAEALAMSYPVGVNVPVYYRPERPREAVLLTGGRDAKKHGEMILASIGVVVGIGIAIAGFHGVLG